MLNIKRWDHNDCTLGRLRVGGFQCFTLELPWLENQRSISCVPKGKYKAFKRQSPKNGLVIEFENVPDTIPDVASSKVTLDKLLALLPDKFEVTIE
jgi:hypothetical protein